MLRARPIGTRRLSVTEGLCGQDKLNALHSFFLKGFEAEMCGLYDIPAEEWQQYCGRAGKPKLVWRQAGGAPAQHHPSSGKEGRQWRLMQRRVEDVALALQREDPHEIAGKLAEADKTFAETAKICFSHIPFEKRPFVSWWQTLLSYGLSTQVQAEAVALAKLMEQRADFIEKEAAKERAKLFREWAKRATQKGGGAAHAFSRIPAGWRETLVPGGVHPTGGPEGSSATTQRVVDVEICKWQVAWVAADTPPEDLPPWPIVERLLPSFEQEIRDVGRSYSWRTGLGLDQLHPKHLSLASNQCLHVLGYFFYCCEVCGTWAEAMEFFSFFLLAKPTGGFRTIGLLTGLYRVWAKLKMPLVRAWAAGVPRAYFTAGMASPLSRRWAGSCCKPRRLRRRKKWPASSPT